MLGTATTAAATLKTATQSIRLKTASLRTSVGNAACHVFNSRVTATPVQPRVSRQLGNGRRHPAATGCTAGSDACLALRRARSSSLRGAVSTSPQSVAGRLRARRRPGGNLWRGGGGKLQKGDRRTE